MAAESIFHKIARGDIPAEIVHDDGRVMAFKDIHPKAPLHLLFIAKNEADFVASIADVTEATRHVPGLLIDAARAYAEKHGIDGYRLTFHVGAGGGQEVFYLHLHFLSSAKVADQMSI